jgi:hypothetical protein
MDHLSYAHRSPTITAARWHKNGDHPLDHVKDLRDPISNQVYTGAERKFRDWEGDIVRYFRRPDCPGIRQCQACFATMHDHGWIDTPGGGRVVCPGDWIVTIDNQHYPCKPNLFDAIFRLV